MKKDEKQKIKNSKKLKPEVRGLIEPPIENSFGSFIFEVLMLPGYFLGSAQIFQHKETKYM